MPKSTGSPHYSDSKFSTKRPSTATDQQAEPPKVTNQRASPISRLPDETMATIFHWLFHDGTISVTTPKAVLLVCQKWRQVALSDKSLWKDTSVFALSSARARPNPEWDFAKPPSKYSLLRPDFQRDDAILRVCDKRTHQSLAKIMLRLGTSPDVDRALRTAADSWPTLEDCHVSFGSVWAEAPSVHEYQKKCDRWNRSLLYILVYKSPGLRQLQIKIPAPMDEDASTRFPEPNPSRRPANLESLTLLDSEFVSLANVLVRNSVPATVEFWTSISKKLRICNVATLTQTNVVHHMLLEACQSLEVVLVNANVFGELVLLMPARTMVFSHLKRLCLLGTGSGADATWTGVLPCLEEIEGNFTEIAWALGDRLKSATFWVDEAPESSPSPTALAKLSSLQHLTIIGPSTPILNHLITLATPHFQSLPESVEAELLCPSLEVLTLIVGRNPTPPEIFFSSGCPFNVLTSDYRAQVRAKDAVHRLVRERKRFRQATQQHLRPSEGNQSLRAEKTLKRISTRNYWCTQRQLWDLRVTYSTKMTQVSIPTTAAPEGAYPIADSSEDCIFDIVPDVPERFDEAEWKAIVSQSMLYGLCE
ncbi:unnamed protein product [Parajaminaea phylloscopi]